jgi:uncharacterized protein (TIGR02466 family)
MNNFNLQDNENVLLMFPTVFYYKTLDIDIEKVENVIKKIDYQNSGSQYGSDVKISKSSSSNDLLENKELLFVKNKIEDEFNSFNERVLRFKNTFKMTTSWSTRTDKNEFSHYHRHRNCFYSGVYYLKQDENSAGLLFEDLQASGSFFMNVHETNMANAKDFVFKPDTGSVIFFPSHIFHKILVHNSDLTRYSIAFNFLPEGNLGVGDSSASITINNIRTKVNDI